MQPSSRPTITDIAQRAGVFTATVSKVMNRRYGVAAATAARVTGMIDELRYQARLSAASLCNQRKMGPEAMRMIVRLIRGEALADEHVTLPTRLIERASTARIGAAS